MNKARKKTNWMLLAVLCVVTLSQFTFTSCKDKDELSEEEKQQKQEQEAEEQFLLTSDFWQVVGQLSTAEVLPDDWQNTTFEPGIGQASDKSASTRIVPTNDAEAAAESFTNLTGADVTGLDSYEWKRDFGTLTYKKSHDGLSWATVDVDIKQMPGLKRIVYCTPEQQGLNANVPGTPYYRFGDVIKKKNANSEWEYWVCVRPCFGPEKKGDSHWMCLGNLPESNIKIYEHDTRKWWFHKSLATNDEHIKNLSEMTFAILNPEIWEQYYDASQKKHMFHDFDYENIEYHDRYFWTLVQRGWKQKLPNEEGKTVFELLFHRTMEELKSSPYLHFFYGSASGPNLFSWYLKMQTASVNLNPEVLKFRELVKKTHNKSCDEKSFDIHEYSETGHADKSTYFDDPSMFIYPLRYATGKTLLGSQPGYYQTMEGSNDIKDVYVFNKYYNQGIGSDKNMKSFDENDTAQRIFSYFQPGTVIKETATGRLWICYSGWYDDGTNRGGGHKARFLSFNNLQEEEERYYVNGIEKKGTFYTNLIPEEEAPMAMACIFRLARIADTHSQGAFRAACKKYFNVKTEDFILAYDTVVKNKSNPKDYVYAFSMPYEPTNGRTVGTQPYLRMVADYSNNSFRSEKEEIYFQYCHFYYYKHYNEENRKDELLNLTHLFDGGTWIGDESIKSDRWSSCELTVRKVRNGDFTSRHSWSDSYIASYYAYGNNQWYYEKEKPSDPKYKNISEPIYTDAYFAPVIMASYMEIDDSERSDRFTGNYNGKSFELVHYPTPEQCSGTMAFPWDVTEWFNGLSFLDEEPFNPIPTD